MKSKYFLLAFIAVLTAFSSCKKEPEYDAQKQLEADEVKIKEFIATNNISAVRHSSGLYYQIITPGTGDLVYTASTAISANYTLRLLNGETIPQPAGPINFTLGGVISGWQIGIPLIQQGGKIRLIVPSVYAYGAQTRSGIPPNSVLDFDIELVNATN
jgi:FKBP-type peptidyl-prolyl cis-trans isomerase